MGHTHDEINHHVKTYFKVFGALLVLTGITVAVSYLHLSMTWALIVGLSIATFKAGLVASFFMHLKDDVQSRRKWISNVLVLTAFFFVWMIVIILLHHFNQLG